MTSSRHKPNLIDHNREAWDRLSTEGILWGEPVSGAQIESARQGDWQISLAGAPFPTDWLGTVQGKSVLCLASGGGQQGPILAAAGANVSVLDLSSVQLEKDEGLAAKYQLPLRTIQGNMTDLSHFAVDKFDVVLMPVSVNNVPDPQLVFEECFRVIRDKGVFLAGFINPVVFLFEENDGLEPTRGLEVKYKLPFDEYESMSKGERREAADRKTVFQWSHTMDALIGGQLRAGFHIIGFEESYRTDERAPSINRFSPTYFTTKSVKPAS